jgi:predicted  nucleic acid-binding Zn-ribbon protein
VHPDLKTVIELQHVDLRIAELNAQVDALPAQIKTLEDQLKDFLQAHEDHKHRLAANQKERRELEAEIQLIQVKISKHKDQLYQVKTNEQYKAMLKEIEGEEANIRKIEDKVLEKMLEAEELQKLVTQAEANLEGEKARVAAETKRLHSLRDADIKERDELAARRAELVGALNARVLDTYERVRKARRGVAVAEVRDGFCAACNVRLRPQVYNEVRRSDAVIMCETCSRIFYVVEAPVEAGDDARNATAGSEPSASGKR